MNNRLLDPASRDVLYDIRNDAVLLAQIQEASLSPGPLGLTTENGVVGSPEWWVALKEGRIKKMEFVGVILRVDGGPMGDSAIMRIKGKSETKSWVTWEGFQSELIGSSVEICYALVRPKHPPFPDFVVELILQVRPVQEEATKSNRGEEQKGTGLD